MRQRIATWHDISKDNHERHPNIMQGFVQTFTAPIDVMGYDDAGNRAVLARITAIDTPNGRDLFGVVEWVGAPREGFVKVNWWFGLGSVGLSSAFVDAFPHRTEADLWHDANEDEHEPDSTPFYEDNSDDEPLLE